MLCAHRVVTQAQLGRLFPGVPDRTLRYRTRRLHGLGLAGRSRPYRERGSAPNHHWPTRRADCLMRGDPVPRGGERRAPNPLFLAHAAALTELYVTLATGGDRAGLSLRGYLREGEAREPFEHVGKKRALAPDALLAFVDGEGRELLAFVELDLGTMSHARLRQKAELYGAYAAAQAWRGPHAFQPVLLFCTTTDVRAARFLRALAGALSYGPKRTGRRALVAGAGGVAWRPGRLLAERCLADLDGRDGLTLLDVLYAGRAPYERQLTAAREHREAEAEKRRRLLEDPVALREHLRRDRAQLESYARALGQPGETAFALLLDSTGRLTPDELGVLRAVARDLGEALGEPGMHRLQPPGEPVRGETALLIETYKAAQHERLRALAARHGEGPRLRRAIACLRSGGLLDRQTLEGLPRDAERDEQGRREQTECRVAYEAAREAAARSLARKAGPLGRFTHRPEDFYAQLDEQRLRVCGACHETVFPTAGSARDGRRRPACHYCAGSERIVAYHDGGSRARGALGR
ncbi:MAG TPA: replication-relaxation family protein [Solirubrobacteraceae bacterium]|nr:replication-relaxation family protein [Solirubrobacteraceae bacterium]